MLQKEERNPSSTSEEPSLLGSAVCRRHTSNSEGETFCFPGGSIFVLEGTERLF